MERDPAAVLQAAIRGVVDRLPESVKEDKADSVTFQPAKFFVGRKDGFYFGTGPEGTGYYLDESYTQSDEQSGVATKQSVGGEELLKEAEEQAGIDEIQLLDAKSLRRHVAAFERKLEVMQYKDNLEMRMKYADQPEKFMESELDLDEEVQRLLAVAGSPELYPDFVKLGAVENLMALLSHENADIAADVIDLFQQLTDADVVEDSEVEATALVESMIEHNGIELLVFRLTSLTESASEEEGKAVFNTLSILENMVEVKPEVAEMVFERSKLLKWMLGRLRPREFDSNKQSTAELLAILLQNSPKNQQRLADANGIDALLQAIAPYKNRNPGSIDEEEYLENLFNSLCACLMSAETRSLFLKAEGVELMLLILKQKRLARAGALKALDFATTRSPANCERFVEQYGLRTVFAMFMGKCKVKRRKGEDAEEAEEEERALSTIANLFQGLSRGSRRDRLAAKFVESEFEKCDRLMELYSRYHRRIQAAEAEAMEAEGTDDFMDEEGKLSARMDQGLYSLQQCALIVGHIWFVGDLGARKRILQLLHQKSLTLADVRDVLTEFLGSIGDEGDQAEAERERNRVKRMLTVLGFDGPIETTAIAETAKAAPAGLDSRVNGFVEHTPAQPLEPVADEQAESEAAHTVEREKSPATLPDSDAEVPREALKIEETEQKNRPDERRGRHESRDADDDERRREKRRRRDEERHESKHGHREDRDRRHRSERERESKQDRRRRDEDDRRERKRDRH